MYLTAGYMDTPPVVILPDATFGLEILQLYRRSRYTDYWILSVGPDVLTVWIRYDTPPVLILPDATLGLGIMQLYRRSRYTD